VKTVILCGGLGTRLREETEFKPKPMATIGDKPILWHIMKLYSSFGFHEFVLCLGYKGEVIKNYFLEYDLVNSDFTIRLGSKKIDRHSIFHDESHWSVTLAETGLQTMTGGRIKKIQKYIDGSTFMLTYGDGVANLDIKSLLRFHKEKKRIATITAVRPIARFGELSVDGDTVQAFREKPQIESGWINGGFFVFEKEVFDYLDDDCLLEKEPLENLARDRQLAVYRHTGYWRCMDTYRDFEALNQEWAGGQAGWMTPAGNQQSGFKKRVRGSKFKVQG
jgi:glucose-1-phosphate cytidylyltransferase